VDEEGIVTEAEAREVGETFLLERYPKGKVSFAGVRLTSEGDVPSYCLEGEIKVHSGTLVAQFLWPADRYRFKIWVSTAVRRILKWEMH
jgi:hypothetical protein